MSPDARIGRQARRYRSQSHCPPTGSPITITDAELATTIFVRDPTAARFPVWPEPRASTDGSRGYLLSRRARRPAPSVRYPNKPWIPVHRRQQDRDYPDHRALICRESGNRLSAWSARKRLALPAAGARSRYPPNGRDLSVLVRDSPAVSRSSLGMRPRIRRTS